MEAIDVKMNTNAHKLYYDINEVAARYGFEPSKLRYWETVFPMLKPQKRSGDRIYTPADIELLDEIVDLVERKKHKLSAVKKIIETGRGQRKKINNVIAQLESIKRYLEDLKELC